MMVEPNSGFSLILYDIKYIGGKMKLKEMDVGINGKIVGFSTKDKHYRQKLLRMGLVKGETFSIIRKAPLGDPIEIKIKGYSLTLRKNEADALKVEVVK